MKHGWIAFVALFIIFFSLPLSAQFQCESWITGGHSQARSSGFTDFSLKPSWTKEHVKVGAGFDFGIVNPQHHWLNAWNIESEFAFHVKKRTLFLHGGFWHRPFSDWIREYNIVVGLRYEAPHWNLYAGNNARVYSLTSSARELWPGDNTSEKEWRNLMYHFEFLLKPRSNHWNVSAGVTDFSPFIFHQETNFMVFAGFRKSMSEKLTLFTKCWYQNAGSNNLQANYFGFFIQGGAIWKAGN